MLICQPADSALDRDRSSLIDLMAACVCPLCAQGRPLSFSVSFRVWFHGPVPCQASNLRNMQW